MPIHIKLCDTIACLLVAGVVARVCRFLLLAGILGWQGVLILAVVSISLMAFAFWRTLEADITGKLSAGIFGIILALIFP